MLARSHTSNVEGSLTTANTTAISDKSSVNPTEDEQTQLVRALVRRYMMRGQIAPSEWTRIEGALMMLSDSLLASSMGPAITMSTEDSVAEAIQKRLGRLAGDLDRSLRFSHLFGQLRLSLPTPRLWQSLYFILRAAEKGNMSLVGGGGNVTRIADLLAGTTLASGVARPPPPPPTIDRLARMQQEIRPLEEYWKQYDQLVSSLNEISENVLLKDLILPLRGFDGTWIRKDERNGKFTIPASVRVMECHRQIVEDICQCAWRVLEIRRVLQQAQLPSSSSRAGIMKEALMTAVEKEIRSYLMAVNEFEQRVNWALQPNYAEKEDAPPRMTLSRAALFFDEYEYRLRFVLQVLHQCSSQYGIQLIPILCQLQYHGDDDLAAIGFKFFRAVERPFLNMVVEFVKFGQLSSPDIQFIEPISGPDRTHCDFKFVADSVPTSYVSMELAEAICETGRTRAFLRTHSSNQSQPPMSPMDWDAGLPENERARLENNNEPDVETLKDEAMQEWNAMIDAVATESKRATKELAILLFDKCELYCHLEAISQFLHFGRGDFAISLLENTGHHLAKPAAALFRHALATGLDDAILAMGPSSPLATGLRDRMDVRLHESSNPKLTGWDVFTLDYRVDPPLDTFISPAIMEQHVKLSHFLWSLHRVAYVMDACVRRVQSLRRMSILAQALGADFKRLDLFLQEGSAVARQVNILVGETVYGCWKEFLASVKKSFCTNCNEDNKDENDDETHENKTPWGKHRGLAYYQELHLKLLKDFHNHLPLFSNPTLKGKLAMVLSCLLRTEQLVRGYERYASLLQEHDFRQSGGRRSSSIFTSHPILPEDEAILASPSFPTAAMRMLAEQRALLQNTCRTFQNELDELLLQLQKTDDEFMPYTDFKYAILRLDFGGYHKRRNGFDQRKYCLSASNY